jgi:hypothetical protein
MIALCSEIHTESVNTICYQKVEMLNVQTGGARNNHGA